LELESVGDSRFGVRDEEWVHVSISLEGFAFHLFGELHKTHSLHLLGGLIDGVPATHLVGLLVESFVSLGKFWCILVVVLWGSDGPGLLSFWVDLLGEVSALFGFLLEFFETFAHLGEHVKLHEVLREGAVAGRISISAIIRVGEAGGGFVVVIRVGFGGGNVGAWALGGVSGPLSAVIGSITKGSAVSLHVTIVGEVEKGVKRLGVLGMVNFGNLVSMGRVVAEVDHLETIEEVVFLRVGIVGDGFDFVGWRVRSVGLEIDELSKFSGGVRSVSSNCLEHLSVGVVGKRLDVRVGLHSEWVWDTGEDVHLVVFVKVEEDGLFDVLEVGEHLFKGLN